MESVGKWWSGGGLSKLVKEAGKQINETATKVSAVATKASDNVSTTIKSAKSTAAYAAIRKNVGSAVDALGDLATTAGMGGVLADPVGVPVPHRDVLVPPGEDADMDAILAAFPEPPVDRYMPYRAVILKLADDEGITGFEGFYADDAGLPSVDVGTKTTAASIDADTPPPAARTTAATDTDGRPQEAGRGSAAVTAAPAAPVADNEEAEGDAAAHSDTGAAADGPVDVAPSGGRADEVQLKPSALPRTAAVTPPSGDPSAANEEEETTTTSASVDARPAAAVTTGADGAAEQGGLVAETGSGSMADIAVVDAAVEAAPPGAAAGGDVPPGAQDEHGEAEEDAAIDDGEAAANGVTTSLDVPMPAEVDDAGNGADASAAVDASPPPGRKASDAQAETDDAFWKEFFEED